LGRDGLSAAVRHRRTEEEALAKSGTLAPDKS